MSGRSLLRSIAPLLVLTLAACASPGDPHAAKSDPYRTIYFGGPIVSMAGSAPETAEAVITRDDRIEFVGSLEEASSRLDPSVLRVDLKGRTLAPGFIDGHVHFGVQAQTKGFEVIDPWEFANAETFIDHVGNVARNTKPGEWIIVFGFDRVLVPPFRNLTKDDLDRASVDHPILVLYLGLHWATANSRALDLVGIDRNTATHLPGGGVFFKDDEGEPTGLATETAVFEFVHHLPASGPPGDVAPFHAVGQEMASYGVTTFADRASGAGGGTNEIALYKALAHDPTFPQRIVATPLYQLLPELDEPTPWDGFFQATQIKLLIDASLVGGTSATLEPQIGGSLGNLNYPAEDYRRALREAAAKGFATATHTMGDRGHRVLLEVFESLGDEVLSVGRHSIEHSALVAEADIPRIARLGLSVSHLAPMVRVHGDAMSEHVYGPERTERLYDSARMRRAGVNVALHSDAPNFAPSPLTFVSVAANRITTSGKQRGEPISVYEALRGITIEAAHHLSLEKEIGSIEAGKLADFVVLDRNPLDTPPSEIEEIKVLQTILGGRTTYPRP